MDPKDFERIRELYQELEGRSVEEQREALDALELSDSVRAGLEAFLGPEATLEAFEIALVAHRTVCLGISCLDLLLIIPTRFFVHRGQHGHQTVFLNVKVNR